MASLDITKAWMETCGDASLEGALYEAGIRAPQKVTLRFERTHVSGKGPGLLLMPDFAPSSLLRSVLDMVSEGYQFEIETYFTEEKAP